ncbi:MAG: flavodoxin family protein [candidate division WS1 bacterium]|nr:flavodoxin family protein [candidate division WS1 bacterium]
MGESQRPLIVAVAGSPRRGGNTEQLLSAAAQGAAEEGARVEWVRPNEMNFVACQHCGGCTKTGVCVIRDDMQAVYTLIERMAGMLLASPVYFASVTAQVKALIDRAQALWARKYLLRQPLSADGKERRLLFLSALGGEAKSQIEGTRGVVRAFAATFDGQYEELIFPLVDQPEEITEHWTALPQAHAAGASLVARLGR